LFCDIAISIAYTRPLSFVFFFLTRVWALSVQIFERRLFVNFLMLFVYVSMTQGDHMHMAKETAIRGAKETGSAPWRETGDGSCSSIDFTVCYLLSFRIWKFSGVAKLPECKKEYEKHKLLSAVIPLSPYKFF